MTYLMRILGSLWKTFRAGRLDREIREEIDSHLAMIEEEERGRGASAEDARHDARIRFGSRAVYREQTRDSNIVVWLDSLLRDVRFGLRQLRRDPGFATIAILLLALGIGLNAAIFTVIDSVVLRALPLPQPDRVMVMMENEPDGCCSPPSWLDQRDIRERTRTFQSLAAYSFDYNFLLRLGDQSMRLRGGYVTHDYFSTLGVKPVSGRFFSAQEQRADSKVALLREDFWQTQLDGDPDILHKTIAVNGETYNVIGILPSWFRFPVDDSVIWAPLVPQGDAATNRGWHGFPMVGRIKTGVSVAQARSDFDRVIRELAREYPEKDGNRWGALFSLRDWKIGDDVRNRLMVLQIAALALFVMACANVSSLLLARDSLRRREFAIRGALGASRARQMQQHVSESILLMGLAGAAAIAVAWAGVRFLIWLYGDSMPRAAQISADWRLVCGTIAIATLAALALALSAATQESGRDIAVATQASNRTTEGRRGAVMRRALVVLQVSCAVALLGGAGELVQSMWRLLHEKTGIDADHLVALHVSIPSSKYPTGPQIARFYRDAVSRMSSLAGMSQIAAINLLPIEEMGYNGDVNVEGRPHHSSSFFAEYRWIAGDYFRTMHIPLLRGRYFLPEETQGKQAAVIINRSMARALWGNDDPIGARITTETPEWATVVGVVRDVRQSGLQIPPRPELFYPARMYRAPFGSWSLIVRSPLPPVQIVSAVRRELKSMDPDGVVYAARTMHQVIADSVSYSRVVTTLLLCFSILATALAALGIYGVVSYIVQKRAPEFAIRAAMGAQPTKLAATVAGQGLLMIVLGLTIGAACVIPLNIALARFLYGVDRLNTPVFGLVLLILLVCGLAATFFPAARAARVDPIKLLREE